MKILQRTSDSEKRNGESENNERITLAFDVQPLANQIKLGIAGVIARVLDEIVGSGSRPILLYFSRGKKEEDLQDIRRYEIMGARLCSCSCFPSNLYKAIWLLLPLPYRWFFHYEADITHFMNNYVPPGVRGKTIVTVHDIIPLTYPKFVAKRARLRARLCAVKSCERADHIITVSHYSKAQIVKHCHSMPEKITVIPNTVDEMRFNAGIDEERCRSARKDYDIDGDYFFYMGALLPHKNLSMLIHAYAEAYAKNHDLPALVIGGSGCERKKLENLISALGMAASVRLIGYVGNECVPPLMKDAKAFLFPSICEGFGLPPLEAMACGTPVLCSNATSLPEVVGGAGILLDPSDTESWAKAMLSITQDDRLCSALREKGLARAKCFSQAGMLHSLQAVYEKVHLEKVKKC